MQYRVQTADMYARLRGYNQWLNTTGLLPDKQTAIDYARSLSQKTNAPIRVTEGLTTKTVATFNEAEET